MFLVIWFFFFFVSVVISYHFPSNVNFIPRWSPRPADILNAREAHSAVRFISPWFIQIKCCPKSGREPKWMTTSCPSILPSSATFSLTGVVGGRSQLPSGKKQLITALQLASVSRRQNQQRVCTSAIWIQSDAINIFPPPTYNLWTCPLQPCVFVCVCRPICTVCVG